MFEQGYHTYSVKENAKEQSLHHCAIPVDVDFPELVSGHPLAMNKKNAHTGTTTAAHLQKMRMRLIGMDNQSGGNGRQQGQHYVCLLFYLVVFDVG